MPWPPSLCRKVGPAGPTGRAGAPPLKLCPQVGPKAPSNDPRTDRPRRTPQEARLLAEGEKWPWWADGSRQSLRRCHSATHPRTWKRSGRRRRGRGGVEGEAEGFLWPRRTMVFSAHGSESPKTDWKPGHPAFLSGRQVTLPLRFFCGVPLRTGGPSRWASCRQQAWPGGWEAARVGCVPPDLPGNPKGGSQAPPPPQSRPYCPLLRALTTLTRP